MTVHRDGVLRNAHKQVPTLSFQRTTAGRPTAAIRMTTTAGATGAATSKPANVFNSIQ